MVALCVCFAVAQTNTITHVVDRGETLASIAKRYSTTEAKIIELNPDAAQFVYVGMELTIPTSASQVSNNSVAPNSSQSNTSYNSFAQSDADNTDILETSDFETERKNGAYELTFSVDSFDDVKSSGSYGFAWTVLLWDITPRLYAGIHFSTFVNYGLSDYTTAVIKLGPALGYYFTPKIFISMPLDVCCSVYFGENDQTKTAWGMDLAPAIYLGNKAGFFIGPQFSVSFSGNSKVNCGFRTGIYF
jgi:hypothetical protein